MKSLSLLRVAAAFLLLAAAPAAAQQVNSPYRFVEHGQTIGVFGAQVSTNEGPLGVGPKSGVGFGARYGIAVSGPFVVELELLFTPTTRAVVDTSFTTPDSARTVKGEADVSLLTALGNVRFNVTGGRTWNRLQPFLLFGGGLATDLAGASDADTLVAEDVRYDAGSSFAGQLGAGVEWHLSPTWAVRLDARTVLWKVKNPTAFRVQEDQVVLPADQWENHGVFSAGLSIRF
jgi:opacity protein-like surface antigen